MGKKTKPKLNSGNFPVQIQNNQLQNSLFAVLLSHVQKATRTTFSKMFMWLKDLRLIDLESFESIFPI